MRNIENGNTDEATDMDAGAKCSTEQQPGTQVEESEALEANAPFDDTPSAPEHSSAEEVPAKQDEVVLNGLADAIAGVEKEVVNLGTLLRGRSRTGEIQQEALEHLYNEMRSYKENFLQKALEPMYRSLVALADSMDSVIADGGEGTANVEFLREELLEVLNRYGVEPFSSDADVFDPSNQKTVLTIPTDQEALHRTIVAQMHPGYRTEERTIRPEQVTIYVYKPTATPEECNNNE